MRFVIVLLLLLSFNAHAELLVGAGSFIAQKVSSTFHKYSDLLIIEYNNENYSVTGVIINKFFNRVPYDKPLRNQFMLILQREYGNRFYFKPGISIVRATRWNSALNFCLSVGVRITDKKLELMHCSNGGVYGKNHGFDFLTLRWSFKRE